MPRDISEPILRDGPRTYTIFCNFRKGRLRLHSHLSLQAAEKRCQELRALRFHDPDDVFIVDDATGAVLESAQSIDGTARGSTDAVGLGLAPSTDRAAAVLVDQPVERPVSVTPVKRFEQAVEHARRVLSAFESSRSLRNVRAKTVARGGAREVDASELYASFAGVLAVAEAVLVTMKTRTPSVAECMRASSQVVGPHEPISLAQALMRASRLRYLPVTERNWPVGILSSREVELVADVRPECMVKRAMTAKPFAVAPEVPVDDLVRVLIEREQDAAVVVAGSAVRGIVTATDALAMMVGSSDASRHALSSG
jgi:CBS domain-containing protein